MGVTEKIRDSKIQPRVPSGIITSTHSTPSTSVREPGTKITNVLSAIKPEVVPAGSERMRAPLSDWISTKTGVAVDVGVEDAVKVGVKVGVRVDVAVGGTGVEVFVAVGVRVGVSVGIGVGNAISEENIAPNPPIPIIRMMQTMMTVAPSV